MSSVELMETIKRIALHQIVIQSAFDGDAYLNWNSSEIRYGSFNVSLRDITYNGNLTTYSLVLYYGDRLLQDGSNANQIYTDGINALQSIINLLNRASNVEIEDDIRYTPFIQTFADYLAGVYTTINLTTEMEVDYEQCS
jgi:hypothetical protein